MYYCGDAQITNELWIIVKTRWSETTDAQQRTDATIRWYRGDGWWIFSKQMAIIIGDVTEEKIRTNCDSNVMKFTQWRIDSEQQNSHEHKHYRHFYYFISTIINTNIWIQTQVDCCLCRLHITDDVVAYFDSPYLFIIQYNLETGDWLFFIFCWTFVRYNKSEITSLLRTNQYEKWKTIIEIEATPMNKMKPCQSTDCPYEQQLSDISVLWWVDYNHRQKCSSSIHPLVTYSDSWYAPQLLQLNPAQ